MENKPREWWINPNRHTGAISEANIGEGFIHMIEYRAYEKALEGKENWYKLCIEKDKRMSIYLLERDAAIARAERTEGERDLLVKSNAECISIFLHEQRMDAERVKAAGLVKALRAILDDKGLSGFIGFKLETARQALKEYRGEG